MPRSLVVRVPDIGEFRDVDVVELLVAPGARVAVEDPLVVIESDKASMEVPSPVAGVVESLAVAVGDQVSEGDAIATLRVEDAPAEEAKAPAAAQPAPPRATPAEAPAAAPAAREPAAAEPAARVTAGADRDAADVLVLGGGPGGYSAAFRAADLGLRVLLVERDPVLGGVCLNVGCIPSKALLHMAEVIEQAAALEAHGVAFGAPKLDFARIRARKDEVVRTMTRGLTSLAKQRKVEVVHGEGRFRGPNELAVSGAEGERVIGFRHAIVAVGSRTVALPGLPDDPRVLDSTSALELEGPPGRFLVIGGGIIGLEMATVYDAFGFQVSVVELLDHLMDGADRDLVRPLEKRLRARYQAIWTGARVAGIEAKDDALHVALEGEGAPASAAFERVLVAVGRRPNGDRIDAARAGLTVDERGFVPVDDQRRTNLPHVFAIGDVAGAPMLAHKAFHEGKVAAEVIAGQKTRFAAEAVPSVAYTDPEVAWTGLTEERAKRDGIAVSKGLFPWSASGRAVGIGRSEGLTKLLFSEAEGRLLGAGMVGPHAGELVAEATLAIEMGADASDIGLTIHPHPTLSETVAFAAEAVAGTITDLLPRRRG